MIVSFALVTIVAAQGYGAVNEAPEAVKEQRKEAREAAKEKIGEARKEMKDEGQARREAFKARVKGIKDERKRSAIERVDTNLADLNKRTTAHLSEKIDRISDVVSRLTMKSDAKKAAGKDVTAVEAALTAAQAAITMAKTAITAQAAKTYVIAITTDAKLRADVETTREALKTDLKAVRETVKAAKDATRVVAEALDKISE